MLDDIKLFIKLVDAGSFSNLAKLLDTYQTNISRTIKDLEASLKMTLIKRDQRTFEMTEDGKRLYEQFKQSTQNVEVAWRSVFDHLQDMHGTLRLTLTTEGAKNIILQRLPQFLNQYPGVKLHVTFTTQRIQLINQNFDIAISSELQESPSHQVKLLRNFDFKLYASPKYVAKYGKPETLEELLKHRFIGSLSFDGKEQNNCMIQHDSGESLVINYSSSLYMDTTSHACELAKGGEYITGAWENIIKDELVRGELIPILPEFVFMQLPCYLMRRPGSNGKLEQKFAEFIEGVFNDKF